jgi:alpha/beta hydrolase family protein
MMGSFNIRFAQPGDIAELYDPLQWVVSNTPPPPSKYPRVSDGTLVAATSAAMGWPNIPNTPKPDGVMNSVLDYDYGPQFRYNDGSGVYTNVPPPIKQVIPTLAPKVDSDGNEIAGVRSLLIQLPLGTYPGWNPIASGPLKGREASLSAGYIPFAKTKADRIANNDPRPSIEERYSDLWEYYFRANAIVSTLVAQRYLLPDDANLLINTLLNNFLASGVLPKRGTFAPGMEPTVTPRTGDRLAPAAATLMN